MACGAVGGGGRGGGGEGDREAARAWEAAGARAGRAAARSGVVRGARPVRAASRGRVRDAGEAALGRRGRDGLRDRVRPHRVRVLAGLHGVRRLVERGVRGEDLQGDGHGRQVRLPGGRDQRLGRGADPGGRRLAGRLRGDLLAQRAGLRGDPADLARDGAVRRRRRLLARDHRLHADGGGNLVHVHHRPRRREDGDGRGGDVRGARRRRHARRPSRGWPTSPRRTRTPAWRTPATCSRSCRRTTSRPPPGPRPPTRSTARTPSSTR